MCGIAGWITRADAAPPAGTMESMLEAIAHRGPDDQGIYTYGSAASDVGVVLGHRRLSIIDPVGARQPMVDDSAGLALSFNGEIYNFKELRDELIALGYSFTRMSDTEVLLRAYQQWGEQVVPRLRGMFAFAVWDAKRERLFMARDRFGEKPLFLAQNAAGVYFASEIKALLKVPGLHGGVDHTAVWDYLAYRYVPGPKTLFSGIRKLPPASCALWEHGRLREWRYWVPPDRMPRADERLPGDIVGAFLAQLDEAVEHQMVSDVPFGAFLSGGIDSSMIVALMSRHSSMVKTFSVGFGEDRYSELAYASEVAGAIGTSHHELVVDHRDIVDRLPKLVAYRDAPVSEPSDIAIHMLACEASRTVKMILTGEGSDELLGGYPKHAVERLVPGFQAVPAMLRNRLIEPLTMALPYGYRRVKTAVTTLNIEDARERYVRWFGAMKNSERERLATLKINGYAKHREDGPPFDAAPGNSALRSILYFDQTSWLPDNLLERGDRMTMAASIEARVPFLDHKLAEFVSKLPDDLRVKGMTGKRILRAAGRKIIPERILTRPKVGFRVPVNKWFREGLRGFLVDHLQGSNSVTRAYYDPKVLDGMVADHLDGRQNHEKLLWSLLNLEIWHRQYAR